MYKLLSFDVYGTLINTPPINAKAFRMILEQAGASNIDPLAFYQFWENRNVVHYWLPHFVLQPLRARTRKGCNTGRWLEHIKHTRSCTL
jgi:hypothetical protein